jgi:TorA maturation chaperone TorD
MTSSTQVSMPAAFASTAANRASLCHFLELALAHPGEDGVEYFGQTETEIALQRALVNLPQSPRLLDRVAKPLKAFFAGLRKNGFEQAESAHIALFSANFPQVPCPPYGSLFTAEDDGKRLEEMLAIKQFYQNSGVDVSETFDDLPDHICVELEFLQLLCFREHDAEANGDDELARGVRAEQARFLDRFMLPFTERLSRIAMHAEPENLYTRLVEATHHILVHHRESLP